MGWGDKLHVWGRRTAWSLSGVFSVTPERTGDDMLGYTALLPPPPRPATPPQKKGKRIP